MGRTAIIVAVVACSVTTGVAEARTISVEKAKAAAVDYGLRITGPQGITDFEVSKCHRTTKTKVACKIHILLGETGTPPYADCDSALTVRFKSAKSNSLVVTEGKRTCL